MTIAISLKINDGVILASDSAATIKAVDEDNNVVGVSKVYTKANKIFNLKLIGQNL